ncbi:MAG: hypothetical protein AABZ47_00920 [Planctomycetota bacterium]
MKFFRLGIVGALFIIAAGCASNRSLRSAGLRTPEVDREMLTSRARNLWQSRVQEDWNSVFEFFEPKRRDEYKVVEFREWSEKNEQFMIHSFDVNATHIDGDMGWVHVDYNTSIRRFPNLAARDVMLWEKWRRTEGEWYPVPKEELNLYPESPSQRNADAEQELRARFEQSWSARHGADWARLYELTDPRDHSDVDAAMYAEGEGAFQYLACKVMWVEVIEDMGRVLVTYNHRVTDKSMEKLPPRDAAIIERWTKVGQEWYRDLKW